MVGGLLCSFSSTTHSVKLLLALLCFLFFFFFYPLVLWVLLLSHRCYPPEPISVNYCPPSGADPCRVFSMLLVDKCLFSHSVITLRIPKSNNCSMCCASCYSSSSSVAHVAFKVRAFWFFTCANQQVSQRVWFVIVVDSFVCSFIGPDLHGRHIELIIRHLNDPFFLLL